MNLFNLRGMPPSPIHNNKSHGRDLSYANRSMSAARRMLPGRIAMSRLEVARCDTPQVTSTISRCRNFIEIHPNVMLRKHSAMSHSCSLGRRLSKCELLQAARHADVVQIFPELKPNVNCCKPRCKMTLSKLLK